MSKYFGIWYVWYIIRKYFRYRRQIAVPPLLWFPGWE